MRAGVSWWGNYLPPPRMGYSESFIDKYNVTHHTHIKRICLLDKICFQYTATTTI